MRLGIKKEEMPVEGYCFVVPDLAMLLKSENDSMPPADAILVAVGHTKNEALCALADLVPKLGEDPTPRHADGFGQHALSDELARAVRRANRMLGSIQIRSVAAIFDGANDQVAVLRVVSFEEKKERVVYQESLITNATNLLTKINFNYFERLADAVLARF